MHGEGISSMKKASFEVALKSKKQIAEGTWAFVFEKPQGFQFKAGQHIRMTLINPPETDERGNSRFFSLANSTQETDLVIAMRMGPSTFKKSLEGMPVGEKVLIQVLLGVPYGAFALNEDASKPAVFLVGGIGIVPVFSMIKEATEKRLPHKMFLFYSNRRPEDAPYLAELQDLAKQNPNFTLIATMTEAEKSTRGWQGQTGFINASLLKQYVNDLQSPIYYVAGLPEMTSAMKKTLADLEVSESNINAEEFTGFNLNEIQHTPTHTWKRHVLIGAIVLVVVIVGILHVTAASSLSSVFSLKNPIFYLMLGVMLAITPFKIKHVLRFHTFMKKRHQKLIYG